MHEGTVRTQNAKEIVRPIWTEPDREETVYVWRCSKCGSRKEKLMQHWFFTGLYCLSCILDVLYDNCRTIEEVSHSRRTCVIHNRSEEL
mgnify:CR=1 FL=1